MRGLLVILLVPALVFALVPDWTGDARLPVLRARGAITATPVLLDAGDPRRTRVGRLRFMGGLRLGSADPAFGGFSSLNIAGDRFTLLSDGGNYISFRLGGDWQPRALWFGHLPAGPGTGWEKADRDSESMAVDPTSGRIWVGFEGRNEIWRFAPAFARAERFVRPKAMADWEGNGGPESLVRLRDGTFLTISEMAVESHHGVRAGLVFAGDPTHNPRPAFTFSYRPPRGYDVSDATELPDGRIAILNRAFDWPFEFTAKITIVDRAALRPGGEVRGREIAALAPPLIHDNFEGIAATRENRATTLWLVSDDNQTPVLQRTLLLKFELDPGA